MAKGWAQDKERWQKKIYLSDGESVCTEGCQTRAGAHECRQNGKRPLFPGKWEIWGMSTPRWMRFLLGIDDLLFLCFTYFWEKRVDSKSRPWRIYVLVSIFSFFFFPHCWYVVIQFSSFHTHKITYTAFLSFSLCRQSRHRWKTRITDAACRPAYVEAQPIIKDAPIHIHDRNLVISEHPPHSHTHTHTYTQDMTHSPAALMNIYARGPANKDTGSARALSINTGSRVWWWW